MLSKKNAVFVVILLNMLCACDPRVSPGNVNPDLPAVNFVIRVMPSAKWINKGDTVDISTSVNKVQPGNIIMSDGYARIDASISYSPDSMFTPQSPAVMPAETGVDDEIIPIVGKIEYAAAYPNYVSGYLGQVQQDSVVFRYKIVAKKKGLFIFEVRPGSVETSNGRAGTNAYFAVADAHWSFFSGIDTPKYGTVNYNINYHLGVR